MKVYLSWMIERQLTGSTAPKWVYSLVTKWYVAFEGETLQRFSPFKLMKTRAHVQSKHPRQIVCSSPQGALTTRGPRSQTTQHLASRLESSHLQSLHIRYTLQEDEVLIRLDSSTLAPATYPRKISRAPASNQPHFLYLHQRPPLRRGYSLH